jgi:murein DD-endopeptidase MepM/ murein hydrolase activator NlpD
LDIIFISRKENRRINLHVKYAVAILAVIIFIGLLAMFIYNVTVFASNEVDQKRLTNLNSENKIIRQEIARIEREFSELNVLIDSLESYDKKLRTFASLEPINEDLRNMGVGGYSHHYNDTGLSDELRSNLGNLSQTLDNLLARSRLQKNSFDALFANLEEKRYLRNHTPSIIPVQGWFMSGFGYRIDPFTGKIKMHEGLDIAAPPGTPIIAPADGVVKSAGNRRGFGLTLEINHGYGFSTLYAHCQRIKVHVGAKVKRGDIIAYVGSTGKSTGPHLHYEVHVSQIPVNPINYILTAQSVID